MALISKTTFSTAAAPLAFLDVCTRATWRTWLGKHHTSSRGVWVVFHKAHTGVKSMPYDDFVREALCFGWIDSLVKRLDDDRFAIKATPRKPASKWSDINRRRWKELKTAGLLTPAGLAAAPTKNRYAPKPNIPELPSYIGTAIKSNRDAWVFFRSCREGSAATSSSGSTSQSDRRLASGASANRSRCLRWEGSSA